jgi:hypothetical protein
MQPCYDLSRVSIYAQQICAMFGYLLPMIARCYLAFIFQPAH